MEETPLFSLQMPEEEVSYPLIGQRFLDQKASQRIVQVHFILQHLETQCVTSASGGHFPFAGDAVVGEGVPERAAAGTGTACRPSDLEPGSEERIPGPSGLESCSPATPELARVPSETIPSTSSTSGGGETDLQRSAGPRT